MMITAVIIEDEALLRETNRFLLNEHFPDINIVGEAASVEEAVKLIKETNPSIVLMDIELMDGNCFQVLQRCKPYTFRPVFITAYNQYAIKAIKFSAVDYILKPVNEYEFCNAIKQALSFVNHEQLSAQADNFLDHYTNDKKSKKLVLRTAEAFHIVNITDIIYCKSDNSYTSFFLLDGREIVMSKSIKVYSDLLSDYGFIRPHQSFLVNMNHIARIDKSDGGFVIMQNKTEIPISLRRKQMIISELDRL